MNLCLILGLAIQLILSQSVNGRELFVEIQHSNGSIIKQDLVEYIEEGKVKMATNCDAQIENKAVMVLGLTGTGKTTLVNYLNGVELVCLKDPKTRKWIIDIAPNATSLPCGFNIGHTTKSETIFPAIYTYPGKSYSYVDNPGFKDTRGIEMEIANNFFRSYASELANDFKFVLLSTHQDLDLRGTQFRETIKRFIEILGVFSDADLKNVSKSIAIIMTRVDNDGDSDEIMREYISQRLLTILLEEKDAGLLTSDQAKVFTQVINNNQVEIFSNPRIRGPVGDLQSRKMISLIESLSYIDKEDAKFQITIAPSYLQTLVEYIDYQYNIFKKEVQSTLANNIKTYINTGLDKAVVVEEVKEIESTILDVISQDFLCSLETFINRMNDKILKKTSKAVFIEKKEVLDFFVELLPDDMQGRFNGKMNYLNEFQLENTLNNEKDFLTQLTKQETFITDGVMTIKACFIKTSDIAREIQKSVKVKKITIHSCQAVHFDIGLDLVDTEVLTIISPKWNVPNNVNIFSHVPVHSYPKATNAIVAGGDGADGSPGLPGKNGGRFYGFGNRFSNLDKLSFYINGSQGGTGQEGGNGKTSPGGTHCNIPGKTAKCIVYCPNLHRITVTLRYEDYSTDPSPGGNGGQGGLGGFAGDAGLAKITRLDDTLVNNLQVLVNRNGSPGQLGRDGDGGAGALGGWKYRCTRSFYHSSYRCCTSSVFGVCVNYSTCIRAEYWKDDYEIKEYTRTNGKSPTTKNSKGRLPKSPTPLDTSKELLHDYKQLQNQNGHSNFYPSFLNALDHYIL